MYQMIHKVRAALLYYHQKGYYRFIGTSVLKVALIYALIVVAVVLIGKHVLDLNLIFQRTINSLTDRQVILLFTVSELLLVLIPPDIFMIWAEKFSAPLPMLLLLGVLSYGAGLALYGVGVWVYKKEKVKAYIEQRLQKYIALTQRWGGVFIAMAALFPFCHYSMVVLAVSLLKYPLPKVLLYGLFRVVRFVVQGTALIKLLEMNF